MDRARLLNRLQTNEQFDILVIGGGATGLGVALDAISRGFSVALAEKVDFGKGTSSKSTKLLHGGVRYLEKGDVGLVIEALKEREFVLKNAPHLSRIQRFIIPHYSFWQGLYYFLGLRAYNLLSWRRSLGHTNKISAQETKKLLPNLKRKGLKGGVIYSDGQFDDTRLCIDLVTTITKKGGVLLNYCSVDKFIFNDSGAICGAKLTDHIGGQHIDVMAKSVVNATGVFAEETMAMEGGDSEIKIVPSRGSHIVLDRSFLNSEEAIMIPKTSDDRVLFLVPWKNVVIVGTTDVVSNILTMEPKATEEEIKFILKNAGNYLRRKPTKNDILSTYAGLRPLVASRDDDEQSQEISRSHKIVISPKGLFSVLGGKWTTFRKMGEDTVDQIIDEGLLEAKESTSEHMPIENGWSSSTDTYIHPRLPYTWKELKHCVKEEMVEHVEDLLCRRSRCILLHKMATIEVLDQAIDLIADQKGFDDEWKRNERLMFLKMAESY